MNKVEELRGKIAAAITRGEDTAELEKELRTALIERQADDMTRGEVAKAHDLARQHQAWQAKAAEIISTVERQNTSVKKIMDTRDGLVKDLQQLLKKLKELLPVAEDACCGRYRQLYVFKDDTRAIPAKYFTSNFELRYIYRRDSVPMFDDNFVGAMVFRLEEVLSIWQGLYEVKVPPQQQRQPADVLGEDVPEADAGPSCSVCAHPQRAEIDQAIQAGTPLRDIEKQYGTSKSSLSRHSKHLDNIS